MSSKTFMITGVSSGFGRAFAKKALAAGHRVVGTVRNESDRKQFIDLNEKRAFGFLFDVTKFDAAATLVEKIEREIGSIDVLINNAGYGHEGVMEESSMAEIEQQFKVNVFGCVALIKAVLPSMRKRRAGYIINLTSMGGYITMPGISDYCGSKFAMVGISDSLSKELSPFNINVTSLAPGSFRTDWAGRSMSRTPRQISDYNQSFEPIREARIQKHGRQLGDPDKAADVVLKLVGLKSPPVHLVIGSDALTLIRRHLTNFGKELDTWETLTCSTDG